MNLTALRDGTADLFARHETEPPHPLHVSKLALDLFDSLAAWHGWAGAARGLLECAALLHDIGWAVTASEGAGHHKASARLIREYPWTGLEPAKVLELAAIARYHRRALPSAEHRTYATLDHSGRQRVRRLGGILRVADGLDRRHVQAVTRVWVERNPDVWVLRLQSRQDVAPEIAAAKSKADLLTAEAQVALEFVPSSA
jgi:exopolyphosphatase/guanosine-5'-triphosphate,3'-diphosphate pyrophosphatase